MNVTTEMRVKIATEASEFEAIHALNYDTFVEEIPQHARNSERRLVDQFHEENTYVTCSQHNELVGMIALRDRRPFSLDFKLADLDHYLPKVKPICELRLLVVRKDVRFTNVAHLLLMKVIELCLLRGYEIAVISGTLRQTKLYRHLGFVPFGPVVGTEEAPYQPMYLLRDEVIKRYPFLQSKINNITKAQTVLLQPGPVHVHPDVQQQFQLPAMSHRSEEFKQVLIDINAGLCRLAKAKNVVLLMGSGTLGNDVVAGQLAQAPGRGLVLANGEFGERLQDHARRFELDFIPVNQTWGTAFDLDALETTLHQEKNIEWLWLVHCETSTGEVNNIKAVIDCCKKHNVRVAVDCTSSFGTVDVDVSEAWLATAVSGKGLGSYPGISIIFHNNELLPSRRPVPRYLDLRYCVDQGGVPFTLSSHQVRALLQGVLRAENEHGKSRQEICVLSEWLITRMRELGAKIIVDDARRNPTIITIELPQRISCTQLGTELAAAGYYTSYQSGYLTQRNWLQLCFFGENYTQEQLFYLVELFAYYFT